MIGRPGDCKVGKIGVVPDRHLKLEVMIGTLAFVLLVAGFSFAVLRPVHERLSQIKFNRHLKIKSGQVYHDQASTGLWAFTLKMESKTAILVGYQKNSTEKNTAVITLPSCVSYHGVTYTVTSLGDGKKSALPRHSATTLVLPKTLKSINAWALSKSDFSNLVIPDRVVSIGNWAFSHDQQLESIVVPHSVKYLGSNAFAWDPSLKSARLDDLAVKLGNTFMGDTSLTDVDLGNRIITIGQFVFYSCTALRRVYIPDSVTVLDNSAFAYDQNLAWVSLPRQLLVRPQTFSRNVTIVRR